jgi:hypothetical protein
VTKKEEEQDQPVTWRDNQHNQHHLIGVLPPPCSTIPC